MSVAFLLNKSQEQIISLINTGNQVLGDLGITVIHQPINEKGKPSLWPYGIKSSKITGWLETLNGDYSVLQFWGGQGYDPVFFDGLKRLGIRVSNYD